VAADRSCGGFAGFGAAAAAFRANPAMFVHRSVLRAFLTARNADVPAGLQHVEDRLLVAARPADRQLSSGHADIGAIHVEPDALAKIGHHIFSKAGIRAGYAGLGTREAFGDATDQCVVGFAPDIWVRGNHRMDLLHGMSPL
jgi:hypothetical protein